jgi:hypothetical protein
MSSTKNQQKKTDQDPKKKWNPFSLWAGVGGNIIDQII